MEEQIEDLETKLALAIECLEYCALKFMSKKAVLVLQKIKGDTPEIKNNDNAITKPKG